MKRISLFGSYARSRIDLYTDLDVLVIMDTDKPFIKRITEIYRLLAIPVDADVPCYTPQEFERMKEAPFQKKPWLTRLCYMRKEPDEAGKRWLEQA